MVEKSSSFSPAASDDINSGVANMPSQLVKFWQAFSRGQPDVAQDALRSVYTERLNLQFSFDDETMGAIRESTGAFKTPVLPDTPQSMLDVWNSEEEVNLLCVESYACCRARIGAGNHLDYLACGLPINGDDGCTYTTHRGRSVDKMEFAGKAWVIPAKRTTPNGKLRLFGSVKLEQDKLPVELTSEGGDQMLASLLAIPRVWRLALEEYPGSSVIRSWISRGANAPSIDTGVRSMPTREVQTRDEDDEVSQPTVDDEEPTLPRSGGRFAFQSDSGDNISFQTFSLASEPPTFRNAQLQIGRLCQTIKTMEAENQARDAALRDEFRKLRAELRQTRGEMSAAIDVVNTTVVDVVNGTERTSSQAGHWHSLSPQDKRLIVTEVVKEVTATGGPLFTTSQADAKFHEWRRSFSTKQDDSEFRAVVSRATSGMITRSEVEAMFGRMETASMSYGSRLSAIERDFSDPAGVVTKIVERLDMLENNKISTAVEIGGFVFKDVHSVQAWLSTVGEDILGKFCVDMVSLFTLSQEPFVDIASGMQAYAAAFKAMFENLHEGRIVLSYDITYPEVVIAASKNKEAAVYGGWYWSHLFQSPKNFEGNFRNGTLPKLKKDLEKLRGLMQNAIDHQFPAKANPKHNAILSDQLRRSDAHATMFLDSLLPLHRTLKGGGLSEKEAWDRVFLYAKSLFEEIQSKRVISPIPSTATRIWGSFCTTCLLDDYAAYEFVQHPKVSSLLALTSMEREGQALEAATEALHANNNAIKSHDSRLKKLEGELKHLREKNPNLN